MTGGDVMRERNRRGRARQQFAEMIGESLHEVETWEREDMILPPDIEHKVRWALNMSPMPTGIHKTVRTSSGVRYGS